MEVAQRTDVGRIRDQNEDYIGLFQAKCGSYVAIVADGLGGYQAGEVASRCTVETMEKLLSVQSLDLSIEEKSNRLLNGIGKANEKIFSLSNSDSKYKGMATTVVGAIVDEKEIVLAHVGDSRAYLLHRGGLYQLTEDHSYVNLLQKHGQITEEEARTHPQRNMIIRSVGTSNEVEVDLINTPWESEDILLLCSDGLTTMVSDRDIGLILSSNLHVQEKAERLVQKALDAGGKDNISIIILKHTTKSTKT